MSFGKRMYGKCDQVEGVGYVGTMFVYAFYLPIVPLRSMFVTSRNAGTYCGHDVPLSVKSIAMAYVRAAMWTFVIAVGFVAAVSLQYVLGLHDPKDVPMTTYTLIFAGTALATLVSAAALWLSYRLTHASPERREALLALARRRA